MNEDSIMNKKILSLKENNWTDDGCIWNGRSLRILKDGMEAGVDINLIAFELHRKPSACEIKWRGIRSYEVMIHGSDNDTLRTMAKKKTELNSNPVVLADMASRCRFQSKNNFTKLTILSESIQMEKAQ